MSKHGRVTTAKEEAFIQSLQVRIKNKDWVKDALMCDDSLVEQANIEDNSILLVDTKDDYEIIIDIDNQNQTASIRDSFKKVGKKYTVKYNSNGGTGNLDEQEVRAGFSVTLKENNFSKEDYHFVGWSEQKSSGATIYSAGSKYRPEKDVTLYAIWSKDIVTVSFNANSAQGTMESLEVEKNTETKLPENTYTKEGFNFVSWNTNQDGTGTSYNNGDNITIKENTTLYAIWEENVTATVQVSNNKITEGTTIEIGATALGSSVQNVELKLGDTVIYTKNVNSKTYTETLSLDKLSNLVNLEFYNDYTLNLKVISTTNKVKQANQEGIKNYTIGTAANLKKLATIANEGNTFSGETILQIANIDLQGNINNQWVPINKFAGTLNGDYYSIKNVYIEEEKIANFGFIGTLDSIGTVKKVNLRNIYYDNKTEGTRGIGGLVNDCYGKVEECSVSGTILSTSSSKKDFGVGGIVRHAYGVINKCYSNVTIEQSVGFMYVGGIAMYNGSGKVINCYNTGKINVVTSCAGGIISHALNGTIENCYNIGSIKEIDIAENTTNLTKLRGSILGTHGLSWNNVTNAKISNCYYLDTASTYLTYQYNGTTKQYESILKNKKTSAELMNLASTLGSEWTNDVKDSSGNWKYNNGYPILKWQLNSNK